MTDDLNFKGNELEEQASWPELEQKVAAAFDTLAAEGIYTDTEITGSSGDGEYEVRENLEMSAEGSGKAFTGYAYYNSADKKEGRAFGTLSVNIGSYTDEDTWDQDPTDQKAVADKVVAALKAQGLKVEGPEDILPNLMTVTLA